LFGWLTAVLRADTHPQWKHHSDLPKYEVTGGAFKAVDGGRQLMPHHGARSVSEQAGLAQSAGVPAPRAGAEHEAPAGVSTEQADERHLAAGSKLRLAEVLVW
jgi:hypothetical protein